MTGEGEQPFQLPPDPGPPAPRSKLVPVSPFDGQHYVLKQRLLRLFGRGFGIYDASGQLVLQANETPFRWREELRLSGGYGMNQELIGIFGRSVFDFGATYDVVDLTNGSKIGALQRLGLQSLVRDEWVVLDAWDREIGRMQEDTLGLALVRRFLASLIPQNYDLLIGGQKVVDLRQNFNPFTYHLHIDFLTPPQHFDRRLGLAAAVLLGAIEGRQRRED